MNLVRSVAPEGYARHATVVLLCVASFVPGYVVQTLLLGLLSGAEAEFVESYGRSILAIGPALFVATVVGWVANEWYGTSTAVGVAAALVTIYSFAFYALELLVAF